MPANPRLGVVVATAIAFSGATAPERAAAAQYTSAWFFGDSLTDDGNLYAATNGAVPENPPYYEGRRSNGPVWSEYIAQDFTDAGLPTENFAYVFGTAVTNGDAIPDLAKQIDNFAVAAPGKLGALPVAMLWFGANDIFGAIATAAAAVAAGNLTPEQAGLAVAGAAVAAANAVVGGLQTLQGLGVDNFMVFNLPALDQTPAFALLQTQAQPLAFAGTTFFNNTLAAGLAGLAPGINVTTIDAYGLFNMLIADPTQFDLTNATLPCYVPGVGVNQLCEPDEWAFFDPVHPNNVVHAELANIVRDYAAPVPLPLPGLLLAGGLVLMGRLRLRARA